MLESLQSVAIKLEPHIKYVVAELTAPGGETATIVRSYFNCKLHRHMMEQLEREVERKFGADAGIVLRCLGGGHLSASTSSKLILVHGTSDAYGSEPDRKSTVARIAAAHPDFRVREGS